MKGCGFAMPLRSACKKSELTYVLVLYVSMTTTTTTATTTTTNNTNNDTNTTTSTTDNTNYHIVYFPSGAPARRAS